MNRGWPFVLFVVAGCGVSDGRAGDGLEGDRLEEVRKPETARQASRLSAAYRAPALAVELGRGALDFAGQAIEAATVVAGTSEPRTFGTLQEGPEGLLRYEPSPEDRLVVVRAGGTAVELVVMDLFGSGSDTASFFQANHDLRIRVRSEELVGGIWSRRRGSSRWAGLFGTMRFDGEAWEGQVSLEGEESFESDRSGSRYFDNHGLTGQLSNESTTVEVSEHWTFELVGAREGLSSNRAGTASSGVRTVDNVVMVGGRRYQWAGVRTRKAFRDGKPTEIDTYWSGAGEILEDGVPFGRVEKFAEAYGESGGFIGFQLVTVDTMIELERYQAY